MLEHILYNGDPSKDAKLSDLLAKHNGDHNAVTFDKETEYYFTIEKQFENALKVWASGFNGASFSEDDIKREVKLSIY